MFKVGDKVVFKNSWTANNSVMTIDGESPAILMEFVLAVKYHIRHATQQEITSGHRIDNDMGDDSHIENHISKNCKVIDYD